MWLSKFWTRISPFIHQRQSTELYGVCSVEQFHTILEHERGRADRNRHQFSIVVFDVGKPEENIASAQHLKCILADRIRFTDQLGWFDSQRIGVLLPETSAAGAWTLADDIRRELATTSLHSKCSVYTYPSDKSNGNDGYSEQDHLKEIFSEQKATTSQNVFGFSKQRMSEHSSSHMERANSCGAREKAAEPLERLFCRPLPFWKRAMDIVGATIALIVLSPTMVAVAIAIKVTSKGPVIFKQQRAGLGGTPFTFYKFRSMVVDAEARKQDLLKQNERTGPAFKMTNDPRVTRIGDFIRKWSLDELPQLFNVLRGDLSLVGPRPLPIEEASRQEKWQDRRLSVTPGITCLWQVYARHDKSFDRWARLDIDYILRQSLLLDINILLKTLPAILSRKGAY